MKKQFILQASLMLLTSLSLFSQTYLVNANDKGVMLDGYDMVAFQTEKKAVAGNYEYQATYQSAVYHFASDANRKKFEQNPEKYAPQFGGFCAVSTSMNMLEPGDVETWSIADGKLYVQRNKKAQGMWTEKGPKMFIGKANENWSGLFQKYSSKITYKDVYEGQITLEAAMEMGKIALQYMKEKSRPGGAVVIVDDAGMPVYTVRATGTFSAASDVSTQKSTFGRLVHISNQEFRRWHLWRAQLTHYRRVQHDAGRPPDSLPRSGGRRYRCQRRR